MNARAKRALARKLPWPYNGMVSDLTSAIQACGNYLAALGLACYTETCGRQLLFAGSRSVKDWECFNEFLAYMGAGSILNKKIIFRGKRVFFKDAVRNGLVHEYFMKVPKSTVAITSRIPEAIKTGFIIKEPDTIKMVVIPYFNLFCEALARAKREGRM
jgi:hypothetical protein